MDYSAHTIAVKLFSEIEIAFEICATDCDISPDLGDRIVSGMDRIVSGMDKNHKPKFYIAGSLNYSYFFQNQISKETNKCWACLL